MTLHWRPPVEAHPASRRAALMLARRAGISAPLLCLEAFAVVDEIRRHLTMSDPLEIGAAYLLESSGHQRSQLSLGI